MTKPLGGFAHSAISTMFNPPPTESPAAKNLTTDPSTVPPSSEPHRDSNTAEIVGGVVGGVVGLAIIGGLIVWIMRSKSRKHRRQRSSAQELAGESTCRGLAAKPPCEELPGDMSQLKADAELETPVTKYVKEPMRDPVELPAGD